MSTANDLLRQALAKKISKTEAANTLVRKDEVVSQDGQWKQVWILYQIHNFYGNYTEDNSVDYRETIGWTPTGNFDSALDFVRGFEGS